MLLKGWLLHGSEKVTAANVLKTGFLSLIMSSNNYNLNSPKSDPLNITERCGSPTELSLSVAFGK